MNSKIEIKFYLEKNAMKNERMYNFQTGLFKLIYQRKN